MSVAASQNLGENKCWVGRYVLSIIPSEKGIEEKIAHVKSRGLTFVFNFEKLSLPFMHIDLFLY
jgi:hypothetical protein